MTYRNCRKLIENAKNRGTATDAWKDSMKMKLDVFLLADRLTEAEYTELMGLLDGAE